MQDKNDALNDQIRKLKYQIRVLKKKLKDGGMEFNENASSAVKEKSDSDVKHGRAQPIVRKMEREYLGMFAFKNGEESNIMRQLVIGMIYSDIKTSDCTNLYF